MQRGFLFKRSLRSVNIVTTSDGCGLFKILPAL